MRLAIVLAVLAACDEGSQGSGQPFEVIDQGQACLLGHEPAGSLRTTFVADQPVEINVGSFTCLSSSCTSDQMASCAATLSGTTIAITTHASWKDTSHTGNACTDDCGSPSAECATPPLPAGTYTVTLGTHTTTLEVPSMPAMFPCLGDQF